ncbi:MAG: PAS domain S-box protein [Nitrospira sp.]|nr:PAS domain S-box protein [Nitrospira sp.]
MTLWSRPHSLQYKIITAIVMVGLLPLTFSLVLTYVEERRALRETAGANFKEIAVEASRRVEMQITRGLSEAQQLASMPFLRTAVTEANRSYIGKDEAGIRSMIKDWQQQWRARERHNEFPLFINRIVTNHLIRWHDIRRSDYVGIFVTDNRGALVVSSIPQVEYYYGKAPWWQAILKEGQGRQYVSDIYFDPSFGTHVLNVSVPILEEDQRTVVGVVTVLLRRDTLFQSISAVTIGATGHAMLMNSDGMPVICPVQAPEEHAIVPELVRAVTRPEAGWAVVSEDSHGGRNAIVGFAPVHLVDRLVSGSLAGKRWWAFVRQDPQETYASLNQLLVEVAAYGAVVLAVLWGAGAVVARRIVKPIRLLHEGAQRIGAGSLDHHVTVQTGDEIEQLAEAFNRMAGNLKESFGQLEQRMADIRRLEEKYRDLIENSPEMIHQINKAGQFVHVNQTELEKLGYSLDEMLRMRLWDIVPKGQAPGILAHLEQLVSQGRSTVETVFLTSRGTPIDVEIHATSLFEAAGGGLVYSRAFVRDVTQRKLLEQKVQRYTTQLEQEVAERTQQLSQSQQRYKALFDLAADSVFMVAPTGRIVAVNRREEQVFGYAEGDVLGRPFLELVPPAYHRKTEELIGKIVGGERQVPTQEIEASHRSGQAVPVEMDLIRIDDGTAVSVMVQLRDVTERKRMEQQLQHYSEELEAKVRARTREIEETKNYLENLLENANDVIYTLDTEQRFTYVNSKVSVWGYSKEDLIGRPYLSLLSKRHRGRRLKSTLDIGAKQVYEVEVVNRTGDVRVAMVSVSPLQDAEERVLGVLGIARDITDTKKLEQQIRNSEKLASIGRLGAGVAHEINNPLGGILNCLYNLRKGTLPPARQEEYLVSMEDGLRRVQKIVRQLLDFSQQHEPELSRTDIHEVIERVLVLTEHALTANQIRLEKQWQPDLPAVMADRHMMEQVLMNLILNAIQAIKGGGCITIRTRLDEEMCVVDVQDTGCGIPSHLLSRIFDPFFTTKGVGEGTGLGLSVSLGIVERHGGRILVDSEVGKGTTFTLCLPLSRDRAAVGGLS